MNKIHFMKKTQFITFRGIDSQIFKKNLTFSKLLPIIYKDLHPDMIKLFKDLIQGE